MIINILYAEYVLFIHFRWGGGGSFMPVIGILLFDKCKERKFAACSLTELTPFR